MPLTLGKVFDRNYYLRIPFLDGNYNVGVFFTKKSPFLLFTIDPDFSGESVHKRNVKVNMFKNLLSSKFCETFLILHDFRKDTLDIINQFENIKPEYFNDISFILNETITLSKIEVVDKVFFDILTVYGFTLSAYMNEFIFLIAERQNIVRRLNRKIVRTTGIQISTTDALTLLNDFHQESKVLGRAGFEAVVPTNEIIKLSEIDEEE